MMIEHPDPELVKRQKLKFYNQVKRIVENRMIFYFHLSGYVLINLLMVLFNTMSYHGVWWFWIPLSTWGVALVGHCFYAFVFADFMSKNPMQHLRNERRSFYYVHLIVYLLGNILFVILDYAYSPLNYWFIYPLIGWGVGLAYHTFFIFIFRGWKIKRWKQAKIISLMKKYYDIDPFEDMPGTDYGDSAR